MPSLAKIVLLCVLITASDKRTPTVTLPKDIYHAKEIEQAKAEAIKRHKAITFVQTDIYTPFSGSAGASDRIFNLLKKKTVLVLADDWGYIPGVAQRGLSSSKAGVFIPKTAITDPYMTNLIAVIPYGDELEQMKYVNEAKRGITKALRALRAAEKVQKEEEESSATSSANSSQQEPGLTNSPVREIRTWTSASGSTIEAFFVRQEYVHVILERKDGNQLTIPLNKLSEEDRNYIAGIKDSP